MQPFRFVHTADWQLGKPFGQFEAELSGRLRQARIEVVSRIADVARTHGTRHVLVAGDVFDNETPTGQTVRQSMEALSEADDLTWWLLPGNHDPARAGGLWDRLAADGLPENVRALTGGGPYVLEEGTQLMAAPWQSKNPGRDLTADFDEIPTPEGVRRIGIAHGGVVEFDSEAPQSAAIAPDRAQKAGLSYLALGDWHGRLGITPETQYSGTPEPDRFRENDPGHVLAVTLDGGDPTVVAHRTAAFAWTKSEVTCLAGDEPETVLSRALGQGSGQKRAQLRRVILSGRLRLSARTKILSALEALAEDYAFFDLDASALTPIVETDDLDGIDREGVLREAADDIHAEMLDPDRSVEERAAARHALDLLASFAAEHGA